MKAHETEVEKLKEYFDDKMTETERTNYEFLQDSPKTIIDSLYNELLGNITQNIVTICISNSGFLRTILNTYFLRHHH